ncbi:MAG TPA: hypothetical protein VF131_28720 [Blastocatellia bacterium]|nr:hypothetical protein [Blastocatellia bacterium]
MITIDCSDLVSDVARRLSAGEISAELMPELRYGVIAEVEEFVTELLNRIQTTMETNMINTVQNGLSSNPQPTTL